MITWEPIEIFQVYMLPQTGFVYLQSPAIKDLEIAEKMVSIVVDALYLKYQTSHINFIQKLGNAWQS